MRRIFRLATNAPGFVTVTPATLELGPGAQAAVGLTFDGRGLAAGAVDVLLFINDTDDRNEDCYRISMRVV